MQISFAVVAKLISAFVFATRIVQKMQISFAVVAKLISAFVFATRIVQFLSFINTKFQASNLLLRLYSPVCVGPGRKIVGFLTHRLICQEVYDRTRTLIQHFKFAAISLYLGKTRKQDLINTVSLYFNRSFVLT